MNKETTWYSALEQITTFYHASPTWFETGTLLTPQKKKNFGDCSRDFVYLTDAPAPHYSVEQIARERFWYVYQVEPTGRVHPGECDDLICNAATVVAYLGTTDMFPGSSKVVFSPSVKPEAHRCYSASSKRRTIAERSLGAWVQIDKDGVLIEGQIIFADYESLNVLVAGERLDFFASLRDVQVLWLSKEALGVVHDVRLNPWRYGTGWEGCELSRTSHSEAVLLPVEEQFAA